MQTTRLFAAATARYWFLWLAANAAGRSKEVFFITRT